MPIRLTCPCGQALQVKEEHAGRKVRCPACQSVLEVPLAVHPVEDTPPEFLVTDVPPAVKRPKPPPLPDDDEEEDARRKAPRILPKSVTLGKDADDEEDDRPRRRRRRDEDDDEPPPIAKPKEDWFGNTNAGVLGGSAMFVLGIVGFFGLWALGCIWPYALIISVVGLIAMIKGLIDR